MEQIILPEKDEKEINLLNPLVWAYVGDCVYELFIRTHLVNTTKLKVHELHVKAIPYVKASGQAKILSEIEEVLTEDEKNIVRRTRNTQNHHIPKNATLAEYTHATGFEGLIGYLFLTKQNDRLKYILDLCLEKGKNIKNQN